MNCGDEDHQNGRQGICAAVWLQAKVRERGLGPPALSVTHSSTEVT